MDLHIAIAVLVLCVVVYPANGIKPSTKLDISEEVEVFGESPDDVANKKKENAEQLILRQEYLSQHRKEPDIEVFSNDNTQSDYLRTAAGTDTVSIVINNIKTDKSTKDQEMKPKKEDPDIPIIKGYGGLSESEVNHYLKPTKNVQTNYLPQNTPLIPRSGKGIVNSLPYMPYQGPNIQYSRPYIECKTVTAPYYSYSIENDSGYQGRQDWGRQQSNHLSNDRDVPQNPSSCDCSRNSGAEWKPAWETPIYNPRPLYSWASAAQVKPKVEIDGKLEKPFKPSK